jgi:serine phosphatase RsbU (regulator of sigma subunit)
MRRLNDVMHTDAHPDADAGLATLVHAQLDPVTGVVLYSSAGHLPMITVGAPDRTRAQLAWPVPALGGPPIGVTPDHRYTEHEVTLDPGAVLIGFTDGLIERRGRSLDDTLLSLLTGLTALPPDTVRDVEAVADAVLGLAPPGEQTDDTAVIVLTLDAGRY